jgi:(2Fe-2S) ferredoxin
LAKTIIGRFFIMPEQNTSPYAAHVFVCTNDRKGERKSCADNNSPLIKSKLKAVVEEKGWKGKIRISTSGCMGLCAKGSNVIIFPQKIWFSGVTPDDLDSIVSTLERIMAAD